MPERSLSWEVGIEQTLVGGRLTVRGTLFDQRFEDLIQYTAAPPTPTDPSFFNVAAASSRGLELDLGARLGVVTAGLEGTWLDTEVTDSGFERRNQSNSEAETGWQNEIAAPAHEDTGDLPSQGQDRLAQAMEVVVEVEVLIEK